MAGNRVVLFLAMLSLVFFTVAGPAAADPGDVVAEGDILVGVPPVVADYHPVLLGGVNGFVTAVELPDGLAVVVEVTAISPIGFQVAVQSLRLESQVATVTVWEILDQCRVTQSGSVCLLPPGTERIDVLADSGMDLHVRLVEA